MNGCGLVGNAASQSPLGPSGPGKTHTRLIAYSLLSGTPSVADAIKFQEICTAVSY